MAFQLEHATEIHIFQVCVVSNLLYCLHTLWLSKAELRFASRPPTSAAFRMQQYYTGVAASCCWAEAWSSSSCRRRSRSGNRNRNRNRNRSRRRRVAVLLRRPVVVMPMSAPPKKPVTLLEEASSPLNAFSAWVQPVQNRFHLSP